MAIRALHPIAALRVLIALVLLASCSGGKWQPAAEPTAQGIQYARLSPPKQCADLDLDAALAEVLVAEQPVDVSPDIWAELTGELTRVLEQRRAGKLASERPTGPANQVSDLEIVDDGQGGQAIEWTYLNVGDYNVDGLVSINDLTPVGQYYLVSDEDPEWDEAQAADGNGDGLVSINDITPIGQHYGASCGGYNVYGRDGNNGPYTYLDEVPREPGGGGALPRYSWPITGQMYEHYMVAAYDFEGDDRPGIPIPTPNTVVLHEVDLSIKEIGEGTVTLSGDASSLEAGQVIVSGEGEGFLGIVDSVDISGDDAVVNYTQGTLEDLFEFADLSFRRTLSFNDIERFEPVAEGITIERVTGGSALGLDKEGSATLGDIKIKFREKKLYTGLYVQGELQFKLDIETDIQIGTGWDDFGTLHSFHFETAAKATGVLNVKLSAKKKWIGDAKLIYSMYGAPIIVCLAPPVVFTPQLDVYMGLIGEAEVGVEVKPLISLSVKAGLDYKRGEGWEPYSDYDTGWSLGFNKPNLYGKVQCDLNLLSPQPTLKLYGVAGPYAKFHAPFIRIAAQVQTTPPEFSFSGHLGAKAYVGAEVKALGYTLAKYELEDKPLFESLYKLFDWKWPLSEPEHPNIDCPLVMDVHWVNAIPGIHVPEDYRWKPYLHAQINAVTDVKLRLVGIESPGSLESQPYVLWQDLTDYGAGGLASSGVVRFSISKLQDAAFSLYLPAPEGNESLMNATHVVVWGVVEGTYIMENGPPPPWKSHYLLAYNYWIADDIEVMDFMLSGSSYPP